MIGEFQKFTLSNIRNFKHNWDGYGANEFSSELINKAYNFLTILNNPEFSVFATARDSIQIESPEYDGNYLEFEIFIDRIEGYMDIKQEGVKLYK